MTHSRVTLSSTPKTPQFHTLLNSTPKTPQFNTLLSYTPKTLSSTPNQDKKIAEGCVELRGFWCGTEGCVELRGFDVELRDFGG